MATHRVARARRWQRKTLVSAVVVVVVIRALGWRARPVGEATLVHTRVVRERVVRGLRAGAVRLQPRVVAVVRVRSEERRA